VDSIDQLQGSRYPKMGRRILRFDGDTEEDCADVSTPQPRDIGLVVAMLLADIVALVDHVPRCVDMCIDKNGVIQEPIEPLFGGLGGS
jgi:hypothetical protein